MNQQGSAEWIQERLGRFTASEIHKLIPQGKGGQPFSDTGKTYILEKLVELETATGKVFIGAMVFGLYQI